MPKILIIDDDRLFRTLFRAYVTPRGWEVLEAEDGETGLLAARTHSPDFIICDLMMPKSNGFQVCRGIRSEPQLSQSTRIVVTSSSAYASDRSNALEAGADEYVTKPVRPAEFLELLDKLSSPQGARPGAFPAFGGDSGQEPVIRFWGVRGSIPAPAPENVQYGGNTSCVEVRADGEIIILDAGSGIRPLGQALAKEFKDKPLNLTLLLTHFHWDHIQGFPFFAPAYNPKNKIRILSFQGSTKNVEAALAGQMESPYFPLSLREMPAQIEFHQLKEMEFELGPVKVSATFTNHPGICLGYRLYTSCGSIAFLPDNELFQRQKSAQAGSDSLAAALEFARHRDTHLIEFLKGADILMLDSQYDATEYVRCVGWGHSCVEDSVMLAVNAGVKKFFMFHHDPAHTDSQVTAMLQRARNLAKAANSQIEVDAAREGLEIVLRKAVGAF